MLIEVAHKRIRIFPQSDGQPCDHVDRKQAVGHFILLQTNARAEATSAGQTKIHLTP